MNLRKLLVSLCLSPLLLAAQTSFPSQKLYKPLNEIYHKGWIDINKNGVKDIYEDPSQTIEHRVADLHVAPREMHSLHLYPYRKIVRESSPLGVMSSYNDYDSKVDKGRLYYY